MVQHRKKLGKNQRVRRREKRRRDAEAAAEAGAKLSAMHTYFPSSVPEAAKAFGVSKNEQSEGLNVALENQKRAKKLKQKITRGQFDDHHRRLKLLELHVEAAANVFNKMNTDHIAKDLRNLIRKFSAACADGRAIRSTANDALAGVNRLETTDLAANDATAGVKTLEASMENLEAGLEDLAAAMAPTREKFDAAVKTMEERISAIESQVEQLVKGASRSAAQQPTDLPKGGRAQEVWKGRLRSGKKG
ncbi:hypothetical protein COL154_010921 [Colletotrichum chrysophilum]|uniref:uncharacterized protein n=1 Tax=Colletotrichum chrysophilum TaxID=1836956 RepID=UPI002300FF40|nr:uncharacterized protein COL26b_011423 [Colletotrichum chrysophilum]KAJ0345839.1 hypothetical protein KNSL1_008084 [Colletotrichum chrysophilum]KAJ0356626.1 hypothetical protein COL154_010921 [Colletotrichum chrysophilum]KAJ0367069.1 hypothetical protein COL26b_011423 [Colletotrichum chrysophilum]